MGNGLRNYVQQDVVNYATAKWLLLGLGGFFVGVAPTNAGDADCETPPLQAKEDVTVIEAADGTEYRDDTCG